VYRDSKLAAQCRRDEIVRHLRPLPDRLARLFAYRQARVWAGAAGIAGFLTLVADVPFGGGHSGWLLLLSWSAMAVAFPAVYLCAKWRMRAAAQRLMTVGDDIFLDVARLQSADPLEHALERTHRLEMASLALPVVALTLLTPLFVHFVVGATFMGIDAHHFSGWVLISLLLVGHAHLTLLILAVMHVLRVRSELDRGAPVSGAGRGFSALLWTVAASSIPGAVLLCIPPILVALTGLLFVPWMFQWVGRRAETERALLEGWGLRIPEP
jgi:hypothetical protein